jgi:hypothetical protein
MKLNIALSLFLASSSLTLPALAKTFPIRAGISK